MTLLGRARRATSETRRIPVRIMLRVVLAGPRRIGSWGEYGRKAVANLLMPHLTDEAGLGPLVVDALTSCLTVVGALLVHESLEGGT